MERRVYKGPLGEKIVAAHHHTGEFDQPILVGIITVDGEVKTVKVAATKAVETNGECAVELFKAEEDLNDWIDRWMRHMYYGDMAFERVE